PPCSPESTLLPYTTLFRSRIRSTAAASVHRPDRLGNSRTEAHRPGAVSGRVDRRVREENAMVPFNILHPLLPAAMTKFSIVALVDRKSTRLNSSHVKNSYA